MPEQIAQSFIEALHTLEQDRDVEPLVALYAADSTVGNVLAPDHFHGSEGARRFWTEYRGTFQALESSFRNIIVTKGRAALEWTTVGTAFDGAAIQYSGITVLEFAAGQITRSAAYFDPKGLGLQVEAKLPQR